MSTIVYKKPFLVSDSRGYSGQKPPIGNKDKIFVLSSGPWAGALLGISTTLPGLSERLVKWFNDGCDETQKFTDNLDFSALLITKQGVFYYWDSLFPSGPIEAPYFAIGSGLEYALGALEMGATAIRAVEIAMLHDPWSGGDIRYLKFPAK